VAKEFHLDWRTVKALEVQYMREMLRRVGIPGPKVIGLDEVSVRKGHDYRIVVSDLVRHEASYRLQKMGGAILGMVN
jgi:transposase